MSENQWPKEWLTEDDGEEISLSIPLSWLMQCGIGFRDEQDARDANRTAERLMGAFAMYRRHTVELRSEVDRMASELAGAGMRPPNGELHPE